MVVGVTGVITLQLIIDYFHDLVLDVISDFKGLVLSTMKTVMNFKYGTQNNMTHWKIKQKFS